MISLIQVEVVYVRGWLTKKEFLDAFAFGNTLPGPIATKMAGYVGYKMAGVSGATTGLVGVAVPTMLLLGSLYLRSRDTAALAGFLKVVRPVVIALRAMVVWEFAPRALGLPRQWLSNWMLWCLAVISFVLAVRFSVRPAVLIVAGRAVGLVFFR